jgi:predicted N-acetyltransferase YhbS
MPWIIRRETDADFSAVEEVVRRAFENEPHSDHTEHGLVARLRDSSAFVPELSLVAEADGVCVGHILFTRLPIRDGKTEFPSLALAPLSVRPDFQRRGIGSALIREGHRLARDLGFGSAIVLGHPGYYPRFGYRPTLVFGIRSPFAVPDANFMAVELKAGALRRVSGTPEYPHEFGL